MTSATRTARQRRTMRERILKAAMDLFVREGLAGVSMRGIAQIIDYSPASIYRYFPGKDAILRELCDQGFTMLLTRQQELESVPDPVVRLGELARGYLDFANRYTAHYELMFRSPAMRRYGEKAAPIPTDTLAQRSWAMLRETVRACQECGHLPPDDPEAATLAVWGAWHGLASLMLLDMVCPTAGDDPHCDPQAMVEQALAFSLRGSQSAQSMPVRGKTSCAS